MGMRRVTGPSNRGTYRLARSLRPASRVAEGSSLQKRGGVTRVDKIPRMRVAPPASMTGCLTPEIFKVSRCIWQAVSVRKVR